MRTTLTIDNTIARQIKVKMAVTKLSLKEVINQTLAKGLQASKNSKDHPAFSFKVEPHACGFRAGVDQDKLGQLVDELDAEAVAHKLGR